MATDGLDGVQEQTRYAKRRGWPSVEERFAALTVREGEHLRWRGGQRFSIGPRPSGGYYQIPPQVYAWERVTGRRAPPRIQIVSTCGCEGCVEGTHLDLRRTLTSRGRQAGVSRQAIQQRDFTAQALAALGGDWGPLSLTLARQLRALGYADLPAVRLAPPEPHRVSGYLARRLRALGIGAYHFTRIHACPECGARHRRPATPSELFRPASDPADEGRKP